MTASHHRGPRPAPTRRDERGATIVELAIVSVFLLSLFAGTFDFGQAWRTGLATNEAARTGARVASARGPLRDADYSALSGVKAALTSSGQINAVERIVVFQATAANGKVPEACKTSSASNCQVISGNGFRTGWELNPVTTATEASGCLAVALSKGWCPTTRDNDQATAEYYGIWIKLRHDYQFPLLGDGTDVTRTAVMRLEPKVT